MPPCFVNNPNKFCFLPILIYRTGRRNHLMAVTTSSAFFLLFDIGSLSTMRLQPPAPSATRAPARAPSAASTTTGGPPAGRCAPAPATRTTGTRRRWKGRAPGSASEGHVIAFVSARMLNEVNGRQRSKPGVSPLPKDKRLGWK